MIEVPGIILIGFATPKCIKVKHQPQYLIRMAHMNPTNYLQGICPHMNPKNELQEICQGFKLGLPEYNTNEINHKQWKCTISIGDKYTFENVHTGKKVDAEKKTAELVLKDMFLNGSDSESDE